MDKELEKVSKDSKFLFTLLVWYKLCIINNVSIPNESQSHYGWWWWWYSDAGGNPRYAACHLAGKMLTCGHLSQSPALVSLSGDLSQVLVM